MGVGDEVTRANNTSGHFCNDRGNVESTERTSDFSQISFLENLVVALDAVANGKLSPALKSDTTLGVFAHFGDVLLDVFQGSDSTCP